MFFDSDCKALLNNSICNDVNVIEKPVLISMRSGTHFTRVALVYLQRGIIMTQYRREVAAELNVEICLLVINIDPKLITFSFC